MGSIAVSGTGSARNNCVRAYFIVLYEATHILCASTLETKPLITCVRGELAFLASHSRNITLTSKFSVEKITFHFS